MKRHRIDVAEFFGIAMRGPRLVSDIASAVKAAREAGDDKAAAIDRIADAVIADVKGIAAAVWEALED